MAICPLCGKKMGILQNQISEFEGDPGVCKSCHERISRNITWDTTELIKKGLPREEVIQRITDKYAPGRGKTYLTQYLKEKWLSEDFQEMHEQRRLQLKKQGETLKITTGYDFDGYRIIEYKGVISGETVIGTGLISEFLASTSDLLGMYSDSFSKKMRAVKENALTQLRMRASLIGANAVIGIDFDYINFSGNMIGVSANGTAVVIEKE